MGFALLLLSSTEGWSLPPCEGSSYSNCFGTYTWTSGKAAGIKYVGEWKSGTRHGQGTFFHSGAMQHRERHGSGKMFYVNGESEKGYWYDGNKVDTDSIKDSVRDVDERIKKRFYKLYETQSTKETCAICFDEIEEPGFEIRKCGHFFHDDCWTEYKMSKYFANNNDDLIAICPCCRS